MCAVAHALDADLDLAMAVYETSEIVVGSADTIKQDVNGDVYVIDVTHVLKRGRPAWETVEAHCFFSSPSGVLRCPSPEENTIIFIAKSGEEGRFITRTLPLDEKEKVSALLEEQAVISAQGSLPEEAACATMLDAFCSAFEENNFDAYAAIADGVLIDGKEPDKDLFRESYRDLRRIDKEFGYRTLVEKELAAQRYPVFKGILRLGGHSFGYTTLSFRRLKDGWRLAEIAHCK
jgi:hypothetical protein